MERARLPVLLRLCRTTYNTNTSIRVVDDHRILQTTTLEEQVRRRIASLSDTRHTCTCTCSTPCTVDRRQRDRPSAPNGEPDVTQCSLAPSLRLRDGKSPTGLAWPGPISWQLAPPAVVPFDIVPPPPMPHRGSFSRRLRLQRTERPSNERTPLGVSTSAAGDAEDGGRGASSGREPDVAVLACGGARWRDGLLGTAARAGARFSPLCQRNVHAYFTVQRAPFTQGLTQHLAVLLDAKYLQPIDAVSITCCWPAQHTTDLGCPFPGSRTDLFFFNRKWHWGASPHNGRALGRRRSGLRQPVACVCRQRRRKRDNRKRAPCERVVSATLVSQHAQASQMPSPNIRRAQVEVRFQPAPWQAFGWFRGTDSAAPGLPNCPTFLPAATTIPGGRANVPVERRTGTINVSYDARRTRACATAYFYIHRFPCFRGLPVAARGR